MSKTLIRNLFGEIVKISNKKPCPHCGILFKRVKGIHELLCPKNPDNKHHLLGSIEEIPSQTNLNNNEILDIPFLYGKKLKLVPIEGRYWAKRKDVNDLHPEYKISRRQFINLQNEFVEDFKCHWLEEGIDKDFIHIDQNEFQNSGGVKIIHTEEKRATFTMLSISGILKTVSRSSKMKTVLYWLIMQFTRYRLLTYEIERFWKMLQKTESPPELYYFCAVARQLNIHKLEPQKIIGKFRGDLVINEEFLIMIKGRKWHIDPGKQKIYDDTIRERCIQKEGYFLITFWAYEIFQDVNKCVRETIEIIWKNRNKK